MLLCFVWTTSRHPASIGTRTTTVGHDWVVDRETLRPLPSEVFQTLLTLTPRVARYARVTVRQRHDDHLGGA